VIERALKFKHSRAVASFLESNPDFLKKNKSLRIQAVQVFSNSYGNHLAKRNDSVIQADALRLLRLIYLKIFSFKDFAHLGDQDIRDVTKYLVDGIRVIHRGAKPETHVQRKVCSMLKDKSFFRQSEKFALVELVISS